MAFIPIALQVAPLIPGLVDTIVKLVHAVRADPAVTQETLDQLGVTLDKLVEEVKLVRLPS